MHFTARLSIAAAAGMFTVAAAAGTAVAATGTVSVFGTELEQVTNYDSPSGCQKLPVTAHVLVNNTDAPVRIYADPFCLTPSLTVPGGYGSHVAPGSGSFSA